MLKKIAKWYGDMGAYIWDCRWFLAAVVVIFLVSCAMGSGITLGAPGVSHALIESYKNASASSGDPSHPSVDLLWGIFSHNIFLDAISVFTGPILGIFPILMSFANGLLFGVLVLAVYLKVGFLPVFVSIAPHGIVELPTMFLCMGMGLKLGWGLLVKTWTKEGRTLYVKELILSTQVFATVGVPLCLIAALLETYVTTYLITLVR